MPRSHAKVLAAIWDSDDWVTLSQGAQRLYLLLLSQKKLTLVGLLTYTPSRWARLAADTTLDSIEGYIDELEASRFVLVDRNTDELLIRTLVKNDVANTRLLDNRNLLRGLWNAWDAIESRQLRAEAVHAMPDELFETDRCQPHPDALQIRRSPRLERDVPTTRLDQPSERHVKTSLLPSPFALPDVEFSAANQADTTRRLTQAERQQRLKAACEVLTSRHLAVVPSQHNPKRHHDATLAGKLRDHGPGGHALLADRPDLTPEQLADLLEPPANGTTGEQVSHARAEQQAAERARQRDGIASVKAVLEVEPAPEEIAHAALAEARSGLRHRRNGAAHVMSPKE